MPEKGPGTTRRIILRWLLHRTVPFGFQKRYKDYRHGYLRRFPYRLVYLVEGEMIYIYQVRHTRRKVDPEFGP